MRNAQPEQRYRRVPAETVNLTTETGVARSRTIETVGMDSTASTMDETGGTIVVGAIKDVSTVTTCILEEIHGSGPDEYVHGEGC